MNATDEIARTEAAIAGLERELETRSPWTDLQAEGLAALREKLEDLRSREE